MSLPHNALFDALDQTVAKFLMRIAHESQAEVGLAMQLLNYWTRQGHVCLDLVCPAQDVSEEGDNAREWPPLAEWLAALKQSALLVEVNVPSQTCLPEKRPLVLENNRRLYWLRYWDFENQIALYLRQASQRTVAVDALRMAYGMRQLFAPQPETDWQAVATAMAVLKTVAIISGGPGVGKTTTVIKILLLLLHQAQRRLQIALTAPTGKAANRLQQSVQQGVEHLTFDDELKKLLPQTASTLHRLLGFQPHRPQFHFNRDNLLALDVLVIDEASMVDVAMMAQVISALPPSCRLILLGDKDQLSAVESGNVLADLCPAQTGFSADFQAQIAHYTPLPAMSGTAHCLQNHVVLLQKSYRFATDSGIGLLVRLIQQGDGQAVTHNCLKPSTQVRWLNDWGAMDDVLLAYYQPYLQQTQPEAALAAFNQFRVLCAYRYGEQGVFALNKRIEMILQQAQQLRPQQHWYRGRPVMITENDYNLHLFNGDIGLIWPDAQKRLQAYFTDAQGKIRVISPNRLPTHQTAYAMTIHKSQGSEFERVLLFLADKPSVLLNRALLYTAVSRAKQQVLIYAQADIIEQTVQQKQQRHSGLRDKLTLRTHHGN